MLEELSNLGLTTPVVRIGWPDQFIEHGKPDDLRKKYGISVEAALEKLRPLLQIACREAATRTRAVLGTGKNRCLRMTSATNRMCLSST